MCLISYFVFFVNLKEINTIIVINLSIRRKCVNIIVCRTICLRRSTSWDLRLSDEGRQLSFYCKCINSFSYILLCSTTYQINRTFPPLQMYCRNSGRFELQVLNRWRKFILGQNWSHLSYVSRQGLLHLCRIWPWAPEMLLVLWNGIVFFML